MNTSLDRIGYIYKFTSPNGLIYVGQTINIKQRKYCYKTWGFKRQIKLWNHCQKHKWNPLDTFEIIEESICGENKSILSKREIFWINFYNSFYGGLNCTLGGAGNIINHSIETKEKMRLAKLGKKQSKETILKRTGRKRTQQVREQMSLSQIERHKQYPLSTHQKDKIRQSLLGHKHSEETIKKISLSLKGKTTWMKGKHHTKEAKEKNRLAHLRKIT